MAWHAGATKATGDIVTAAMWNNIDGANGNFDILFDGTKIQADLVRETSVQNSAITLAKMANLATQRLVGRDTAGAGVPEALSVVPSGLQDSITRLGAVVVGKTTKASKDSGGIIGSRTALNFVSGTNVTLVVADNAATDRVDVTISASGGTIPTQSQSSGLIDVVTDTVKDAKGAWTQAIASTSFAVVHLILLLGASSSDNAAFDVGVGGAGAEVVKVADINVIAFTGTAGSFMWQFAFPFTIAASARVAICAANTSDTTQNTHKCCLVALG